MLKTFILCAAAAAMILAASPAAAGTDKTAPLPVPPGCFPARNWEGWTATPDSRSIYVRVLGKGVYRLDLSAPCLALQWADAHLVDPLHADYVCSPLDLQLQVTDSSRSVSMPIIVTKITGLTEAEVKALPRQLQPS